MPPPYESTGTLNIASYWWCLAVPERNVLIALSNLIVAMPPFISEQDYRLLWLSTGAASPQSRGDALAAVYYLEPGEFTPPEGEPIQGYYLYGDFWPVLFAWIVGGQGGGAKPCKFLEWVV